MSLGKWRHPQMCVAHTAAPEWPGDPSKVLCWDYQPTEDNRVERIIFAMEMAEKAALAHERWRNREPGDGLMICDSERIGTPYDGPLPRPWQPYGSPESAEVIMRLSAALTARHGTKDTPKPRKRAAKVCPHCGGSL